MAKRMLINAIHPEECRVAIAKDDRLLELEVEKAHSGQLKGNIYKAAISRIEPSLQAAFLDIGSKRNGFLQINDIHPTYFRDWPTDDNGRPQRRPSIQDVLQAGQDLVVQVVKDGRDEKGATLTTNLSLPGRYLVLMVGNQRGGVSRKIVDESQRVKLRQAVRNLEIPVGMGVIVRTAGINKSNSELQLDLDSLLEAWHHVVAKSFDTQNPVTLYQEPGLAIQTIRDYITPDVEEILIDEKGCYDAVCEFATRVMPQFEPRIIYYDKSQPLFSQYHLDHQIEAIGKPEVVLPSGGSIVVNATEAVVAIDVNSGRSTSQADVEETAFNTNLEAADVIAQQLRLRDLGGLIVIDFIDMWDRRHKHVVEKTLRDTLRYDKAKIEMGRISKFGLLEMSRQRLKASLVSQSYYKCPHCNGFGQVKTAESAALEALRKIQSAVTAGHVREVRIRMAPAAALFLLNHKRQMLSQIEREAHTSIMVYADGRMTSEQYELELDTGENDLTEEHRATRQPPRRSADRRTRQDSAGKSDNRSRGRRDGPSRKRRGDSRKTTDRRDRNRGPARSGRGQSRRGSSFKPRGRKTEAPAEQAKNRSSEERPSQKSASTKKADKAPESEEKKFGSNELPVDDKAPGIEQ